MIHVVNYLIALEIYSHKTSKQMRYMKLKLKQLELFSSPADFCVKMHIILYGPFL